MTHNKETVRRIYDEVLNPRNLDVLDEITRPDYEEHNPLPGQGTGLPGLKDRYGMIFQGLDAHFTIEDMVAEDDKVVVRWTNSGTNTGDFLGIPATGKSYSIQGIDIYRLDGGKLAEHWDVVDVYGHMVQLGILPAPGGPQQ